MRKWSFLKAAAVAMAATAFGGGLVATRWWLQLPFDEEWLVRAPAMGVIGGVFLAFAILSRLWDANAIWYYALGISVIFLSGALWIISFSPESAVHVPLLRLFAQYPTVATAGYTLLVLMTYFAIFEHERKYPQPEPSC